jgi:glycosyltransferase involved in cell wall biosynthesis
MNAHQPTIAYLTAGAGGMYCGSCLYDNTLAAALIRRGVDVQLIPVYAPLRTDTENVSVDRVFFGGINVYLQQKIPFFRHLPAIADRLLDQPWLLRRVTSGALSASPAELGALTLSMLRGASGYQRREVAKLCRWLADVARPQLVHLTNLLIAGCVPAIRRALDIPILATLQGDDLFLEGLPERYRTEARQQIGQLAQAVDGFLVTSRFYADFMADYFSIPRGKFHQITLGVETEDFATHSPHSQRPTETRPVPRIGYLARLAPEKGLHTLVEAFLQLRRRPGMHRAQLCVAGWLGRDHRRYAQNQFDRLSRAGLADSVHYAGVVNRTEKVAFLRRLDVLSVPTTYADPKGLFVLEALAAGVPVVQPAHGAFPELLAATGGGMLTRPHDAEDLAQRLYEMLTDHAARRRFATAGRAAVHQRHNPGSVAESALAVYRQFLSRRWTAQAEAADSAERAC